MSAEEKLGKEQLANLDLFTSLFRGRNDVFAIRREKGKRSGYMPVYQYNRHLYHQHLRNGGTFHEFNDKTYLPLTDLQFVKHLKGEHIMGIYPLLKDNNSWFIAADFDKENWAEECRTLILACKEIEIPAYLQKPAREQGNSCFVDAQLKVNQDQWSFLSSIVGSRSENAHYFFNYTSEQSKVYIFMGI